MNYSRYSSNMKYGSLAWKVERFVWHHVVWHGMTYSVQYSDLWSVENKTDIMWNGRGMWRNECWCIVAWLDTMTNVVASSEWAKSDAVNSYFLLLFFALFTSHFWIPNDRFSITTKTAIYRWRKAMDAGDIPPSKSAPPNISCRCMCWVAPLKKKRGKGTILP